MFLFIFQWNDIHFYHLQQRIFELAMKQDSDSDLNEEINDQLSELWTNAQLKRKAMLQQLTPHSRKPAQHTAPNYKQYAAKERQQKEKIKQYTEKQQSKTKDQVSELEILRLRQQLSKQAVQSKQRDMQMEMLRRTAQQLSNQNKYLTRELQQTQIQDENNSKVLNESSIHPLAKSIQPKRMKSKTNKNNRRVTQTEGNRPSNEDVSKQRLVELVRSTSQYRSYVFYYDSNQLSFLKRLQEQHKKNCQKTPAEKEKQFWAPKELIEDLKLMNVRQNTNLTQTQIQMLVSRLKGYFQSRVQKRIQKLKEGLEAKLKQAQRQGQNGVPYQLVQIARARERELSRWSSKRSASMFK